MGRLIDADALCERIRKIYKGYMLDEGCTPIEFENMVDEQPTAYDVDVVVAELERNRSVFEKQNVLPLVNMDYAVDVVKRGGVE